MNTTLYIGLFLVILACFTAICFTQIQANRRKSVFSVVAILVIVFFAFGLRLAPNVQAQQPTPTGLPRAGTPYPTDTPANPWQTPTPCEGCTTPPPVIPLPPIKEYQAYGQFISKATCPSKHPLWFKPCGANKFWPLTGPEDVMNEVEVFGIHLETYIWLEVTFTTECGRPAYSATKVLYGPKNCETGNSKDLPLHFSQIFFPISNVPWCDFPDCLP